MASTSNSSADQPRQIDEQESTSSPEDSKAAFKRNILARQSKGKLLAPVAADDKLFLLGPNNPTFELLIQKAFADKTLFLKTVLHGAEGNYRICLPRAMGKTLTLKMVESFCDVEKVRGVPKRPDDSKREAIWTGTEIKNREPAFFDQHFGQHPTIFMTLWGVDGSTLEIVLKKFRNQLRKTCQKFCYIYDELKKDNETPKVHLEFLEDILNNGARNLDQTELESSLDTLAEIVKSFHGDARTMLLLDEYDIPVSSFLKACDETEIGKIIEFHSAIMETFKSNPYIDYAIVAGILKTNFPGSSGNRRTGECNLLKGTELNEYFGLNRVDIEEMAKDIEGKNQIEIPENIQNIMWDWCNGYSFFYGGFEYSFCNPYTCCVFLNAYVEERRHTPKVYLPGLLQSSLPSNSLVENLKPLFQKKEITETLIGILIWRDEKEHKEIEKASKSLRSMSLFGGGKGNKQPKCKFVRNDLKEEFFLSQYMTINKAMHTESINDLPEVRSILLSYLCHVGLLTLRNDIVVVPNQEIRHQWNDLLVQPFKQIYQIPDELQRKASSKLEEIVRFDGLDSTKFMKPMKEFKNLFTELLTKTNHEIGSELFSHAFMVTLAANIPSKLYFYVDEEYKCLDNEKLKIDLSFALKNSGVDGHDSFTVVIVEMKFKGTAKIAVKEAIYYRKVYDNIATVQKVQFDRFIFIGLKASKGFFGPGVTMYYKIEDGKQDQPAFTTLYKMKKNAQHPHARPNTRPPTLGVDFREVK